MVRGPIRGPDAKLWNMGPGVLAIATDRDAE
jgi:hypothetical protein